jgi:hypothetical protein
MGGVDMTLLSTDCISATALQASEPSLGRRFDPQTGLLHPTPNMNVVNLVLRLLGPCTEFWLCVRILAWQVACCAAALAARDVLASWWK